MTKAKLSKGDKIFTELWHLFWGVLGGYCAYNLWKEGDEAFVIAFLYLISLYSMRIKIKNNQE